jgi:hypothetical protein
MSPELELKTMKNKMDYFTVYSFEPKIRLGTEADGGYVIVDMPTPAYDCYITAGVADEESFSRDFLQKYKIPTSDCYAFDGTINNYPWQYTTNIQFTKKNISSKETDHTSNLESIIKKYKNIFLKMDIEHGEYDWISNIDINLLRNFKQIVIEYHAVYIDQTSIPLDVKVSCFNKMAVNHYIVHAHGNNYGGSAVIDGNPIPCIIEITYIRKDLFSKQPNLNKATLPCSVDRPNNPAWPDCNLNFPPFQN